MKTVPREVNRRYRMIATAHTQPVWAPNKRLIKLAVYLKPNSNNHKYRLLRGTPYSVEVNLRHYRNKRIDNRVTTVVSCPYMVGLRKNASVTASASACASSHLWNNTSNFLSKTGARNSLAPPPWFRSSVHACVSLIASHRVSSFDTAFFTRRRLLLQLVG